MKLTTNQIDALMMAFILFMFLVLDVLIIFKIL